VFKLKEFVKDGIMSLVKIESEKQVADILTKPLPQAGVRHARGVVSGSEAARLLPALPFIEFTICIKFVYGNVWHIFMYSYERVYMCTSMMCTYLC
jgi:hypothetical protein